MTTINICLVSANSEPNVIGFNLFKSDIDHLVLVKTYDGNPGWESNLKNALIKEGADSIETVVTTAYALDEMKYDLTQLISSLNQKYDNPGFLCNITCGTKPMAIMLSEVLRDNSSAEMFYCDPVNHVARFIYPHNEITRYSSYSALTIETLITSKGFAIESHLSDEEIEFQKDFNLRIDFRKFARRFFSDNYDVFSAFNFIKYQFENKKSKSNTFKMDNHPFKSIDRKHLINFLRVAQHAQLIYMKDESTFEICSPTAFSYLAGGWIEEYVYAIAKEMGFDDVKTSLYVRSGNHNLNEIDCIISHNNHLLIIECKTGKSEIVERAGQELLTKLDSNSKKIGGTHATRWLLLMRAPNLKNSNSPSHLIRRAKDLDISVYSEDQVKNIEELLLEWKNKVTT